MKPDLSLREKKIAVSKNKVMWRIFGMEKEEIGWYTKLHNGELHNLYVSHNVITIKSRQTRGHIICNISKILVESFKGRNYLKEYYNAS
jgi:hypothetical protein